LPAGDVLATLGRQLRDIATAKYSGSATDLHAALSGREAESSTMRCRKKLYDAWSETAGKKQKLPQRLGEPLREETRPAWDVALT
jgi:hypothetical protein